jgi:probable F420-dependent oxidoreductase
VIPSPEITCEYGILRRSHFLSQEMSLEKRRDVTSNVLFAATSRRNTDGRERRFCNLTCHKIIHNSLRLSMEWFPCGAKSSPNLSFMCDYTETVLIDGILGFTGKKIAMQAENAEAMGYDALWAAEAGHDPLITLTAAASTTERIQLGTSILVAFGRSPMVTATMANDVQTLTEGRLLLGLGSQIKPHIERRYSMPWSMPAARMREYILALRTIWCSWNDGSELNFEGEFYRHTLMTPFFSPGPNEFGSPKIFLAAVGELMVEVAGEVADGLLIHPFTTERYLREVTLPALNRGLARSGRHRDAFQISYSGLVATGSTERERILAMESVRSQLAFYGSTPAYSGVLEMYGRGDLQPRLNSLSRSGEWEKMTELIDDALLDAFAIAAPAQEVAAKVQQRFGDVIDRFSFYCQPILEEEDWSLMLADLRQI